MNREVDGKPGGSPSAEVSCPICGSNDLRVFLELRDLPAQDGVVWPTREAALSAPSGDSRLLFCAGCSYIWNALYDASLVEFTRYDFSLHYSPLYEGFIRRLAQDLVDRYDVRHKTVLEIGCGQGHFLRSICGLGENQGIGIDPSYLPDTHAEAADPAIVFYRDYFSAKYAGLKADFVVCRHVLDELDDQKGFLQNVRRVLEQTQDSVAYLEVPNPLFTFANGIIWNVGYAKHAWFTPTAFTFLLEDCGLRTLNACTTHGDEYVSLEAAAGAPATVPHGKRVAEVAQIWADIEKFQQEADRVIASWDHKVRALKSDHARVVAWGAGQRAINFLNRFDLQDEVAFVVDINPQRQGMFLPRTGYKVEPPERLLEHRPDIVLITNPTYSAEIKAQAHAMGVDPEFLEL
jgi:SAM-dependent methyltransferase